MSSLVTATCIPASVQKGTVTKVPNINLAFARVICNSEDGELKRVAVHPPNFLTWTPQSAINSVESTHNPPPRSKVMLEHKILVETLAQHGAEVVMSSPKKSLPEAVYQRDSLVVIGNKPFGAKFKFPIRQKELELISGTRIPWNITDTIEFGDVLVLQDCVLVGLGDRTNARAAETLQTEVDKEVIPIALKPGTLHLDYTTSIGGRGPMKTMVVCPELYVDHSLIWALKNRFDVRHMVIVPESLHGLGWTNLLFLDPETVVSTTSAAPVNAELRRIGFNVIAVPFEGILTGEGAPRCCTAPLLRED